MGYHRKTWVVIDDVTVMHETYPGHKTLGAVLINHDGLKEQVWIPKQAIHENSEAYKANTKGKLIIPETLAISKGLSDYADEYMEI